MDLSWVFFNFATQWKSNVAICFSHFWRLKTSKKIAFTKFLIFNFSLWRHVASKKKGWVVDAHPLLIRKYLTTSNHNVNTWSRDQWNFLVQKSSNGEFYFQNDENWVFFGVLSRQSSKKKNSKNLIKFCKCYTKF